MLRNANIKSISDIRKSFKTPILLNSASVAQRKSIALMNPIERGEGRRFKSGLRHFNMDKLERTARAFNFESLLACIIVLLLNVSQIITYFVLALAVLQVIHIIFGDVTDSYRLLRKKGFLRVYLPFLVFFFVLTLAAVIILDWEAKIYFLLILLAFLADFEANRTRVKKLNKNKINKKRKKK